MPSHCVEQTATSLPYSVYPAEWVIQMEQEGARELGLSLSELMQRAGTAAFQWARQRFPQAQHWLVLCGSGNNGGDGYVVAQRAVADGIRVTLIACEGRHPLPAEAEAERTAWLQGGGQIMAAQTPWPTDIDLIIDGLLGTGLSSAPRAPYAALIAAANRHPAPVMALDIPSGLNAATGAVAGAVIQATDTLTFVVLKPGLLTGQARDWVGRLHYAALGLETWLATRPAPIARLTPTQLAGWLPPRRPCTHKGEQGRLLLVGGDRGYGGAIRMAAEAALRAGAGLVRVLTHADHLIPLLTARPELMVETLNTETLAAGVAWADTLVIGPGLGQGALGQMTVAQVGALSKTAVWDADALNLLAISPQSRQNRILTPHPGEAARLLACSLAEIERDRLLTAQRLVAQYGGVVVLKGAGTVIASEQGEIAIADVGNPGMASGGMGDVLAGVIGGLLAQKLSLYDAACAGCVVQGSAADRVAIRRGSRGMLATDLLAEIPYCVNPASAPA